MWCNAKHCRSLTGTNFMGTFRRLSPLNGCVAFPIDKELGADNTPTSPRRNSMVPRYVANTRRANRYATWAGNVFS
jgi:hypothetical protein